LSKEWISQTLSESAAKSSVRLLMLLEPGRATVEGLSVEAGRRMDSVMAGLSSFEL